MIMKTYLLLVCVLFVSFGALQAQEQGNKQPYWLELKNKKGTPHSIDKPETFLSPKAIQRRKQYSIAVTSQDLPVSPRYITRLAGANMRVVFTSRWLNGVLVEVDKANVPDFSNMRFIKNHKYVGPIEVARHEPLTYENKPLEDSSASFYGAFQPYAELVKIPYVHERGYMGQGKTIAVLDGGFNNVEKMPYFDSLRASGRLLGTYDIIDGDANPYESSSHGMMVLGNMAGFIPNYYVGTAPKANYILMKTEDTRSEYPIEECNWVRAAEIADSLGVDIINSSLGYTEYDDKSMSYTKKDLDGKTSIISRGAQVASEKGIIVVNAAGNEGSGDWKYIGMPADAPGVVSVGAVSLMGKKAGFSSFGVEGSKNAKPNIAAPGYRVLVPSQESTELEAVNGTSFASPITAGCVAALWSAFPNASPAAIKKALLESGADAAKPTLGLGNGIADLAKAFTILQNQYGVVKP